MVVREAKGSTQAELQKLAEPQTLAIVGGVIGVFIAAQFTPAGWVADAVGGVLLVGTALAVGLDVFAILSGLNTFVEQVSSRRGNPEVAGKALANAAAQVEVVLLMALLTGGLTAGARKAAKAPGTQPSCER